jgi:hypothetical protein
MRTTLNLDADLMRVVGKRAAETRRSVSSIVESALREFLRHESGAISSYELRWPVVEGGVQSGVNLRDRNALLERMGN